MNKKYEAKCVKISSLHQKKSDVELKIGNRKKIVCVFFLLDSHEIIKEIIIRIEKQARKNSLSSSIERKKRVESDEEKKRSGFVGDFGEKFNEFFESSTC
jgi:hypothetical protein